MSLGTISWKEAVPKPGRGQRALPERPGLQVSELRSLGCVHQSLRDHRATLCPRSLTSDTSASAVTYSVPEKTDESGRCSSHNLRIVSYSQPTPRCAPGSHMFCDQHNCISLFLCRLDEFIHLLNCEHVNYINIFVTALAALFYCIK